jgi:ribose 5-phosphate isomerase B
MTRKAVIGVDHGGLKIKPQLIAHLKERGFEVEDLGVHTEDSIDYPDIARRVVEEYRRGGYEFAVVCCGTGIGISISANKFRGVRCALPQNSFAARMAAEHNDANFLAFGGRVEYPEPVEQILDSYLDAEFTGDRHQRRVRKIAEIEEQER